MEAEMAGARRPKSSNRGGFLLLGGRRTDGSLVVLMLVDVRGNNGG